MTVPQEECEEEEGFIAQKAPASEGGRYNGKPKKSLRPEGLSYRAEACGKLGVRITRRDAQGFRLRGLWL